MKIDANDVRDLQPLISVVVAESIKQLSADRIAYTEAEAAALLGVAKYTLRDCRLRGEIEGALVGKKILYSRSDLLEFIQRRKNG